jgi:uncharacterized protein (DUF488 family)
MNKTLFTIGHSTHTIKEFLLILKTYGISLLVDVRHYPGSRYCPQFGQKELIHSLNKAGIEYKHLVGLGGRRKMIKGSLVNAGWRSPQFRGYADYMQTKEFKDNLSELMLIAKEKNTAIMCAEVLPWRCHRSLISDALLKNGFIVWDIISESNINPHSFTSFAKIYRNKVTYPGNISDSE